MHRRLKLRPGVSGAEKGEQSAGPGRPERGSHSGGLAPEVSCARGPQAARGPTGRRCPWDSNVQGVPAPASTHSTACLGQDRRPHRRGCAGSTGRLGGWGLAIRVRNRRVTELISGHSGFWWGRSLFTPWNLTNQRREAGLEEGPRGKEETSRRNQGGPRRPMF